MVALGAGLVTGLSRFLDPGLALVVAAAAAGVGWRSRLAPCLAAVVAGLMLAHLALVREAQGCATRLPAGSIQVTLHLTDPVVEGVGRGRPLGAGCRGAVGVRVPDGHVPLPAGSEVVVTGRWVPRPLALRPATGTLVARELQVRATRPTPAERLRNGLGQGSAELYGPRAAMVDALVLGRRTGLHPELREDFARSGLVHLLAISGFHVGLLASWTILLAMACHLPRARAHGLGAAVAIAYAAFLGWPAPATRAALLTALLALGILRQRAVRPGHTLAAAALVVMLGDPWAVFDLGAWLSVSAVAGLGLATRWSDRAVGTGWGWRMLAASIGSTLATAPLTAAVLGAVAPIGIVLNFAAIPLAMVAVPGVLAGLVALLLAPPLAGPLAAGAGLALHALELLAGVGARVPGGHVATVPGAVAGLPWLALLGVAAWGTRGGATLAVASRRWLAAGAAASWLLVAGAAWRHRLADGDGALALHFLDVGQGDAALLRTPGGQWVLVDAGPADGRDDAGRRVVAPYLARQGARRLEAALVSHAHADHLGGLPAVLRRVRAGIVVEPAMPVSDRGYLGFLAELEAAGVPWRPARRGDRFELDGVVLEVLHPDTTWGWWGLDLNENSLIVRVRWRGFVALLTGDAGLPAEARLAGQVGPVHLLKVGHHGSRGSTSDALLAEARPLLAVISAGRRNRHGHPAPEALARLAAAGVPVRRTDRDGTIRVRVTAGRMQVRTTGADTTILLPP